MFSCAFLSALIFICFGQCLRLSPTSLQARASLHFLSLPGHCLSADKYGKETDHKSNPFSVPSGLEGFAFVVVVGECMCACLATQAPICLAVFQC